MNTHVSRLTSHVSRLTSHVSRLTSHVSRLKEQILFVAFFLALTFSHAHSQTVNGPKTVISFGGSDLCESTPWKLVFHDEFNGTQLDRTKWLSYFPCDAAQTDNCLFARTHTTTLVSSTESQVFKDENLNVSNGLLTISVKKDFPTWKGAQRTFSSGTIYSNQIFRFQRGKFEIRCKLASGKGLWPAFWLFGGGTEIDVFEFRKNQSFYFEMSLHHWLPNGTNNTYAQETVNSGIDYSQGFHTFAVEWDKNKVSWLVDGQIVNSALRLYESVNGQRTSSCSPASGFYSQYDWYPHNPSDQVQVIAGVGTEGGAPPLNESYPKQMEIDYIRVYQRVPEQWFPPICTLAGADVICTNQNSTFTLPEDLGALTWTVSPNLTIVSQSNTQITVRSKPAVVFGDAFVKADFAQQSVCGLTSSTKNFWIGKPDLISITEHMNFCESCYVLSAVVSPNSKSAVDMSSSSGYSLPSGCSNIGPNYSIPYSVTATNVCGSQSASGTLSPPYCEFGAFRTAANLSVTPNPSSAVTRVSLNNINLKDIAQILILNASGAVVKVFTSGFVAAFDVNVSNYQNGLYNITVMRKANLSSISSQFTVQH